jgi:raffinose/stachyose/melibiose transport system permease protein
MTAAVPARTARPARPRRSRAERYSLPGSIGGYVVTLVITVPLLWIVFLSFKTSTDILQNPLSLSNLTLDNYANVLGHLPLLQMYANTILIALVAVLAGAAVSYMLAFALTRMVFRRPVLRNAIQYYVLAGISIPVFILLFPVYQIDLTLGIFGTYLALMLPYTALTIPFTTLVFMGYLTDFPAELEEAAVVDGAGLWTVCVRVVLPLMRPVIATVFILNTVFVFNEFAFASILINDPNLYTISLAVSRLQGQYTIDYGGMMAAMVLVLLPQLIVYAVFQRQVIGGLTAGAVKG